MGVGGQQSAVLTQQHHRMKERTRHAGTKLPLFHHHRNIQEMSRAPASLIYVKSLLERDGYILFFFDKPHKNNKHVKTLQQII